jgi:8-oxo-dGTP pyrophosphatase MutT (NUDIX family)
MQKKIDIYDKANRPTGKQTFIDYAMRKGLWHRGTHVTIRSESGNVLIQKRSKMIFTHSGFLDIGCGGVVDAGEQPLEAARREMAEEVGLSVEPTSLQYIGMYRNNRIFPRLRRISRCFTYCYVVTVPEEKIGVVQEEEVEWARFMTMAEAKRLVKNHRLRGLGRLLPHYGFYKWQLEALENEDRLRHRLNETV